MLNAVSGSGVRGTCGMRKDWRPNNFMGYSVCRELPYEHSNSLCTISCLRIVDRFVDPGLGLIGGAVTSAALLIRDLVSPKRSPKFRDRHFHSIRMPCAIRLSPAACLVGYCREIGGRCGVIR